MRIKKGLKQEQIGKIIDIARNTISQYENEKIQPTFETIEKIANICDYKIYFENEKTKEIWQIKGLERKDV